MTQRFRHMFGRKEIGDPAKQIARYGALHGITSVRCEYRRNLGVRITVRYNNGVQHVRECNDVRIISKMQQMRNKFGFRFRVTDWNLNFTEREKVLKAAQLNRAMQF